MILLLLAASCGQVSNPRQQLAKADTVVKRDAEVETEWADTDCVRGKAEPIVDKHIYPNVQFGMNKDHVTAKETVALGNGDTMTIDNVGCEYYINSFTFITSRFKDDTTNVTAWAAHAVAMLNEVAPALNTPINVKGGILALSKEMKQGKSILLNKEIDYGSGEIRSFVVLERIGRQANGKYVVVVSFDYGPL